MNTTNDEIKSGPAGGETTGKKTPVARFNKGAQKSGETLGLAAAVILVWLVNEFAGVEVPTMVEQAITAVLVVIAARWRDNA